MEKTLKRLYPNEAKSILAIYEQLVTFAESKDKPVDYLNIDEYKNFFVTICPTQKSFPSKQEKLCTALAFTGVSDEIVEQLRRLTAEDVIEVEVPMFATVDEMIDSLMTKPFEEMYSTQMTAIVAGCLSWYGVTQVEMIDLKLDDLQFGSVKIGDRVVKMSDMSYDLLHEFAWDGIWYSSKKKELKLDTEYVFCTPNVAHFEVHQFRTTVNRGLKDLGLDMTLRDFDFNGQLEHMYFALLNGEKLTGQHVRKKYRDQYVKYERLRREYEAQKV